MNGRAFVRLFRKALSAWTDDYAPSMGAALSYYPLFSIAPLLAIVIAVAGIFLRGRRGTARDFRAAASARLYWRSS